MNGENSLLLVEFDVLNVLSQGIDLDDWEELEVFFVFNVSQGGSGHVVSANEEFLLYMKEKY